MSIRLDISSPPRDPSGHSKGRENDGPRQDDPESAPRRVAAGPAGLAHAAGGPLSARIPRDAREGRRTSLSLCYNPTQPSRSRSSRSAVTASTRRSSFADILLVPQAARSGNCGSSRRGSGLPAI